MTFVKEKNGGYWFESKKVRDGMKFDISQEMMIIGRINLTRHDDRKYLIDREYWVMRDDRKKVLIDSKN